MLQKVTEGTSRKRYMLQLNSQVNFAVSPQVPQGGVLPTFTDRAPCSTAGGQS